MQFFFGVIYKIFGYFFGVCVWGERERVIVLLSYWPGNKYSLFSSASAITRSSGRLPGPARSLISVTFKYQHLFLLHQKSHSHFNFANWKIFKIVHPILIRGSKNRNKVFRQWCQNMTHINVEIQKNRKKLDVIFTHVILWIISCKRD